MRRVFALLGLSAALVVAWFSLSPSQAVATVEGPCTASIDNVNVTKGHDDPGSAVPLQSGTEVPVAGTAQSRVTDLSYTVHIAGGGVQVGSVVIAQDGLSWTGAVDLEKISTATVGLFEVTADVETTGAPCTGTAYVCIEGRSPLTTAAGAGATALAVLGAILLVLSLIRARGMRLARSSLQGFAGGATAGLGGAVLLQQFCTLPLTAASAVGIPVVLGGAGAVGASVLGRAGTGGARRAARIAHGHGAGGSGGPAGEPTEVIHHSSGGPHEPVGAGHGSGGPSASTGDGGARESGGPSPAPPFPGAPAVGGGPSPAPAGPLPAPPPSGGAVPPPVVPLAPGENRTCRNCGTANEPEAQFCTNCGQRLL